MDSACKMSAAGWSQD